MFFEQDEFEATMAEIDSLLRQSLDQAKEWEREY